ncbi:unnamed protein product [Sympodiomycopsis kandeliae]
MTPSPSPSSKLSERARNRLPSAIRSLYPAEKIPGMISLLSGKPNSSTFPVKKITLDIETPSNDIDGPASVSTVSIDAGDLDAALQYGPTDGLPRLVKWVEALQTRMHGVQKGNGHWRCSFGVGSQDCLTKAMEALLNPGDTLLVEAPTYPGILPQVRALGANAVELTPDAEGATPEELESILCNWQTSSRTRHLPFPKLLYLTPTGGNPTGATSSESRKRSILSILQKHDVLLFEDDAYYYLDYSELGSDPITRPRPRSYFSMDPECQTVVRFDSFSKILSSGLRLGFVTGHIDLINAIDLDSAGKNLQPSGISQGVVLAILEHWGIEGFLRHVDKVAGFYQSRRDFFDAAAQKHLQGKASWVRPTAGMFLWIKLELPDGDSFQLVSQEAKNAGVLALPGVALLANPTKSTYVRTSFSQVPLVQVDEAFKRLRSVIDAVWANSK